ncbi:Hypothetical protein R9X50_00035300 [Acrodontium crateriforme]|uniref:SAGA-associated factor 11 n=1 Tax=Acrodontium crateriforme TaxID=150365 RepID=A0AAQ3LXW9_9PEZI|nr:Hypothetical protein R9X50_00035300 [Acrodontium crateriforme]
MASPSGGPSLSAIAQTLLEEAIFNIVHNTIIWRHRDHKMMVAGLDPTTKLPHCAKCKLPRLLDPPLAPKVRGALSEPPKNTEYCERRPWSRRPGHDIYDNPFPKSDVTGRPPTKKEREAAKNSKNDGTPASEEANGTGPPSPDGDGGGKDKLEKGEKKANKIDEKLKKGEYVPWHTCPSCKRSLLITRFAKHLEQCMGLSGRTASRNAMAKMNGSTPSGSRGATPNPNQDIDDDDDDISVKAPGLKKKVLKKNAANKFKNSKSSIANGKGSKPSSAKRSPHGSGGRSSPAPSSGEKRDRDELGDEADEDDIVHVKKRQKLQRVGSTTSIGSQPSGADMDRTNSNDGSFVDDTSLADD